MSRFLIVAFGLMLTTVVPVQAQVLGTFAWRVSPYCNVITVTVVQTGAGYTLDGYDDQCGSGPRAAAAGVAFVNPDGSVGLGFTIVSTPGGLPVHVDATISMATLAGTWRDSTGASGSLDFTAAPGGGPPRPFPTPSPVDSARIVDGSIGAVDVNTAEIQRRINAPCPVDQLMTGVNADGSVACQTVPSDAGGDITAVTAGFGLNGGGLTGAVALEVNVAGDGTANALARADHEHAPAVGARSVGIGASALAANAAGRDNVAVGDAAMDANVSGVENVAVGAGALGTTVGGFSNTAVGFEALAQSVLTNGVNAAFGHRALAASTTGHSNVALGTGALQANASGDSNLAAGHLALRDATGSDNAAVGGGSLRILTTGSRNTAVGYASGGVLTTGNDNIYVGSPGAAVENGTIRIGQALQSRAFVAGVRGVTTGVNDAVAVVIDSNGQLGTVSSSARVKDHIADLGAVGERLQQLRPVRFRYRAPYADGRTPEQYGLIAEEVAEVLPELVVRDADGQPSTVAYHVLPTLLVAEVQRLERERAAMADLLRALQAEVATLRGASPR
ncbi:MAG: tail fiber domain-containing protein [Acidobacteria bacterium]|nr:tail fiber domain-containing protein [Acidobacteriota bacterium]